MTRVARLLERLRSYESNICIESDKAAHTFGALLHEVDLWCTRFEQWGLERADVVALRADYSLHSLAAVLALLSKHAVAALLPRGRDSVQNLESAHARATLSLDASGEFEWTTVSRSSMHPLLTQLQESGSGGLILFTSGSTGGAKAVLHSAERFLCKFDRRGHRLRTLAYLAFDHVAGMDTAFYTLSNGGTLIVVTRRDPMLILHAIASLRIEVLPVTPSFLRLLCRIDPTERPSTRSLRVITYGAELMDEETLSRVGAMFSGVQIRQKYGTTETGSPRTLSREPDSLWVRFIDPETEIKVVSGVLWLRGESTVMGYLNAPSPLDAQGWFCTGDLVDVDREWIRFRGRQTTQINVGGEKVSPFEVELCIRQVDFVVDVAVSGQRHELMGQVVSARVVLASPELDRREVVRHIRRHCLARLPAHKVPVTIEIVTGELADYRGKPLGRNL